MENYPDYVELPALTRRRVAATFTASERAALRGSRLERFRADPSRPLGATGPIERVEDKPRLGDHRKDPAWVHPDDLPAADAPAGGAFGRA